MNDTSLATDVLTSIQQRFQDYKKMGDRTLAQCSDAVVVREISPGANSIAVIVQHLQGNMRSRWTDFLTTDGEKPDRHRDNEFIDVTVSRATVEAWWNEGWAVCLATIEGLMPGDLTRFVDIRGQQHTVIDALNRGLAHTSYHVGQIVMLAKAFVGNEWQTLSIARGASEQFNQEMRTKS